MMTANEPQYQKTILTDDGELRDDANSTSAQQAELEGSTIYCIHCGTPNRSVASFCRTCGQRLDDQKSPVDFESPPYTAASYGLKPKRADFRLRPPETRSTLSIPMMVFSLIRLVMIAGMIISLVEHNNIVLPFGIVAAWILVEAVQNGAINPHGNRIQMTVPMMVFNTFKLAIVGGIAVSIGSHGSGLINLLVPLAILVGWVLTEAIQAGAIKPENS
jgi:hypothetical protein